MHKLIFTSILVFLSVSAEAAMTKSQAQMEFVRGADAYRSGNYKEAVSRFEGIIENNFESGAVYYNLGNSYFKNKEIGKAILNYERAKRLIPRDSYLNFNYHYALSSVAGGQKAKQKGILEKAIDGHVQFYTFGEMIFIIFLISFVISILFLMSLVFKLADSPLRISMFILSFVLAVFILGALLKVQQNQNLAVLIVNTDSKFEPRKEATTHFRLSEGVKVKVMRVQDEWIKIKRLDGKLGWVERNSLERI